MRTFRTDGKKVSAARTDAGGHLEIYIYDLGRGTKSQFSFSQSRDDDPVWSPDGNTIVFDSARNGKIDLYTRPASGARQEELLYHDDLDKYPSSWSVGWKIHFLRNHRRAHGHFDIWVMPMFGDHKPFPFLAGKVQRRDTPNFRQTQNGFASLRSNLGTRQVYVVAFPKPGGKFLVGDGIGGGVEQATATRFFISTTTRALPLWKSLLTATAWNWVSRNLFFRRTPGNFEASADGKPPAHDASAGAELTEPDAGSELAAGTEEVNLTRAAA
jgi:hypothetical protein